MNKEMYSGALAERLMKCSKEVFSTFWKLLSLLKAALLILQCKQTLTFLLSVLPRRQITIIQIKVAAAAGADRSWTGTNNIINCRPARHVTMPLMATSQSSVLAERLASQHSIEYTDPQ